MDATAFALACLALLAAPGPTNMLLAASGAAVGIRRSLALIPAEMLGYGASIVLLSVVLGPAIVAEPLLGVTLKLAAAAYLAVCALRLWRSAGAALGRVPSPASWGRVLVTTFLNPKAIVFALVIFPADPALLPKALAVFYALILVVSTGWIMAGRTLALGSPRIVTPARISRTAAAALGGFSALLIFQATSSAAGF